MEIEHCPKCGKPGLEYWSEKQGRTIFYCGSPCKTLFKDGEIMADEHLHSVENSPEMEQAIEEVFDKFQRMTLEEFEEALRNAPPSFGRWIVESSKPNDKESSPKEGIEVSDINRTEETK